MKAVFKTKQPLTHRSDTNKGDSEMKAHINTNQTVIRNTTSKIRYNERKANKIVYTRLILGVALAIALLAANLQGFALANASDISEDDVVTTRHLTMVYESPETNSRVETVLMPATEVSLAGRSADGMWLALGSGWIQRSDIRMGGDLATLAVVRAAQTFLATTRHLTMVYESPETNSRVETVLMPATGVRLAGRSADGKWLALGSGWIQRSDIRTDGDLAALAIFNAAAAMDVVAGQ
jgi:hypothetical protein